MSVEKKLPASADYEYVKEKSRVYYKNKIDTDADFAKAEKERIKAYKKNRYANDPEYREKMKEKARETYQKKLLKKQGE
jgi:hypothetical protein